MLQSCAMVSLSKSKPENFVKKLKKNRFAVRMQWVNFAKKKRVKMAQLTSTCDRRPECRTEQL